MPAGLPWRCKPDTELAPSGIWAIAEVPMCVLTHERHGISRLPEMKGDEPKTKRFADYAIRM